MLFSAALADFFFFLFFLLKTLCKTECQVRWMCELHFMSVGFGFSGSDHVRFLLMKAAAGHSQTNTWALPSTRFMRRACTRYRCRQLRREHGIKIWQQMWGRLDRKCDAEATFLIWHETDSEARQTSGSFFVKWWQRNVFFFASFVIHRWWLHRGVRVTVCVCGCVRGNSANYLPNIKRFSAQRRH